MGIVLFHGTNSSCTNLNSSLTAFNDPSTTKDDYLITHFVPLDTFSTSLGYSLTNATTYYLKIRLVDKAGLGFNSSCLNFTTKNTSQSFKLNFSGIQNDNPVANDFLQFDFGSGFTDYNSSVGLSANSSKNVKMKFPNFHGIQIGGLDFAQSSTFNFSGILKEESNCRSGKTCVGMDSSAWQQMVQQLGVDNVSMILPATVCGDIYRCNDNGSICTNVTENVPCSAFNTTHKTYVIPSWLGFSTYVAEEGSAATPAAAAATAASASSSGSSSSGWGICGDGNCNDGLTCAPNKETNLNGGACYKDCGLCPLEDVVEDTSEDLSEDVGNVIEETTTEEIEEGKLPLAGYATTFVSDLRGFINNNSSGFLIAVGVVLLVVIFSAVIGKITSKNKSVIIKENSPVSKKLSLQDSPKIEIKPLKKYKRVSENHHKKKHPKRKHSNKVKHHKK